MKKYIHIILITSIFFINCYHIYSQNQTKIDSLKKLIQKHNGNNDVELLYLYTTLSKEIYTKNPNNGLEYLEKAKEIGAKLKDKYHLGCVYYSLGEYYEYRKLYHLTLENYLKSYETMLDGGKKDSVGYVLINIANTYLALGINNIPQEYYIKSADIFKHNKNNFGIAVAYNNIGIIKSRENKPDSALYYFFKALDYRKKIKSPDLLAHSYTYISEAYLSKGDMKNAKQYLDEALKIALKIAYGNFNGLSYGNIQEKNLLSNIYLVYAKLYKKQREFNKAYQYYTLSINSIKKYSYNKNSIEKIFLNIAALFEIQNNHNEAILWINKALAIADSTEDITCKKDCYLSLSDIYHKLDKHDTALDYHILYNKMLDSLNYIKLNEKFSEIDATIKIYQKESELEKERIGTSHMIDTLLLSSFVLLIFASFLFYTNRRRKKDNKLLLNKNEEILKQKNDLIQEINKRIKAEEDLNNVIQFNQEIISNVGEGIIVYNNKFEYVVWNKFMEELFGIKESELIGKYAFDIFPHILKSGIDKLINRALKGEYCISQDIPFYIEKTGKSGWFIGTYVPHFDSGNNIIGVIGSIQDITVRKKTEEEINKISERLSLSTKSANIGIWDWDINNNIMLWDNTMYSLYGLKNEAHDINYDLWIQKIFCDDQKIVKEHINRTLSEYISFNSEFRITLPDNNIRYLKSFADVVFKNDKGKPARMLGVCWDITESKLLEQELNRAKEKAEESDRIKSAFLANMSHEIRTPLNAIIGFTSLLKAEDFSDNSSKKYLEIIYNSGFNLLNLINDIIDLSKIEAGYLKIVDNQCNLNQLLLELYNTYSSEISIKDLSEIKLILNNKSLGNNFNIWVDDLRLKQILTNLLSNALKFTKSGFIEFGVNIISDKKYLKFYVKDSGIGISSEQINIIFERFRQADESTTRKYGGSGLGLAISKQLINLMNGEIWVESEFKKGSTFYFTIPYKPNIANINTFVEKESRIKNINWKDKNLLIVDDIENIHLFFKKALNQTNINIISAENGQQAIDICTNNKNIDIILMDIQLPGVNGYEATRQIKKLSKSIPIIAQTAYIFQEDKIKCFEAGCDDFITKPIQIEALLNILSKYLNA